MEFLLTVSHNRIIYIISGFFQKRYVVYAQILNKKLVKYERLKFTASNVIIHCRKTFTQTFYCEKNKIKKEERQL